MSQTSIHSRLDQVRERMRAAEARAGRPAGCVRLVAVTKGFPAAVVTEAIASGIDAIGENRVQEAAEKKPGVARASDAAWHLIGHLQTNKVARAVETFDVIESIDSARLAQTVGRRAAVAGRRVPVLIEVNVSGEAAKTGASPGELFAVLEAAASMSALELRGLMAMGPLTDDEAQTRGAFARARSLLDAAVARGLLSRAAGERGGGGAGAAAPELSMGMSDDFELAILEGSTMVRIGSALFGSRDTR